MSDIIGRISNGEQRFGIVVPLVRLPSVVLTETVGRLARWNSLARIDYTTKHAGYVTALQKAAGQHTLGKTMSVVVRPELSGRDSGKRVAGVLDAVRRAAELGEPDLPWVVIGPDDVVGPLVDDAAEYRIPYLGTPYMYNVVFDQGVGGVLASPERTPTD